MACSPSCLSESLLSSSTSDMIGTSAATPHQCSIFVRIWYINDGSDTVAPLMRNQAKNQKWSGFEMTEQVSREGPQGLHRIHNIDVRVWCSPFEGNSFRVSHYRIPPVMACPLVISGVSNGQDPMTKRSYNMRAQSSQIRRERSLRCPQYRSLFTLCYFPPSLTPP